MSSDESLGTPETFPVSLETFLSIAGSLGALAPVRESIGDDEFLDYSLDSLATLELLVAMDELHLSVDFSDAEQLRAIDSVRSVYLSYLVWNQMPQSSQLGDS